MTEQYVMGEALKMLIEHDTNLKVELTEGVGGGTSNIEPAMESGQFDLYPEYTGTGWAMVLKNEGTYSEDEFDQLQAGYQEAWDELGGDVRLWQHIRHSRAQGRRREVHLKTYSDLARWQTS
jgi:osmoprotectant transport system permease protein